jgi:hypothetical protein
MQWNASPCEQLRAAQVLTGEEGKNKRRIRAE